MKLTPEKVGEIVKAARQGLGVTQRSLALTSGTGLRFIVDLEKGKPTCHLGKVLTVMNTLGISISVSSPSDAKKDERPASRTKGDKTAHGAEGRA